MSFPRYPAYKDSGVEWLGDVPEHWEVWKLSHAFTQIGSGTTPKTDNRDYYEGGDIPWVNTGDFNDRELDECDKRITELAIVDHSALKTYPPGSLLIAMYGATIGKLAILNFAATVNQACCVFAGPSEIVSKFMFYWFLGLRQQIISLATGGGQPNISQDILRSLRVAIPVLLHQAQIVSFLDHQTSKIDVLIAEQQRLIELLQEKRQAVISHAVTKGLNPNAPMKHSGVQWLGEVPEHWEVRKISQLFVGIGSGTTPKSDEIEYYEDGDIPWVVTGDLNDELLESCSNFITKKAMQAHTTLRLYPKGSVAVAMYGATIGKASLLGLEATVNQACCVLPPSAKVNENFLLHFLISAKNHLISLATGGGQPNINQDIIRSLRIPLPEVKEQIEIVKHLSKILVEIESLLGLSNRQVLLLQERRSALISAAVTGQIDVRGLAAEVAA